MTIDPQQVLYKLAVNESLTDSEVLQGRLFFRELLTKLEALGDYGWTPAFANANIAASKTLQQLDELLEQRNDRVLTF